MNTSPNLYKKLSALGLSFMEPEEQYNLSMTLAEVVESNELRFLEGFPVLLLNAAKDYSFDYRKVYQYLTSQNSERYSELLTLAVALYEHYHLRFQWSARLKNDLSEEKQRLLKKYKTDLAHNSNLLCGDVKFNSERLKKMFELYYEQEAEVAHKNRVKLGEMSLEYSMSQFFSPKQKELLKKKCDGLSLNKTEREYFSRSVKKKLVALLNPDLHSMVQRVVEQF